MKKSILLASSLAVASIILLLTPESRESKVAESVDQAETPLHIFRESKKSNEHVMKARPAIKRTRVKRSVKKTVTKKKEQMDSFIVSNKERLMSDEEIQDTMQAPRAKANKKTRVNNTRRPATPWVRGLSGGNANLILAKSTKEKEKCIQENCGKKKNHINLVGVVVETERFSSPTENLVAGDVKLGDAKILPAVYVK